MVEGMVVRRLLEEVRFREPEIRAELPLEVIEVEFLLEEVIVVVPLLEAIVVVILGLELVEG